MSDKEKKGGFIELPHTADLALCVWAPTMPELFKTAALGMNALAGIRSAPGPRVSRCIQVEGTDDEALLVAFLSEIIYLNEQENLAFDQFKLHINGSRLKAILTGSTIYGAARKIKAATYNDLRISHTRNGFETQIVFDV